MIDSKMSLNISKLASKVQRQNAILKTESDISPYLDDYSSAGIYICTYIKDPRYVYIGKTNNFSRRWEEHITELIKGSHCGNFQIFYQNHKCSPDDFRWEILENLKFDNEIISIREIYWIRKYDNDGYHILLNTQKYREK